MKLKRLVVVIIETGQNGCFKDENKIVNHKATNRSKRELFKREHYQKKKRLRY